MFAGMARSTYGTGSVRQVGRDRWQLRWSEGYDPFSGKHVRRSETVEARNQTEARKLLAKRLAAGRRSSRVTFGELLDATLEQLPIAERTRANYGFALGHVPDGARRWPATEVRVTDARALIEGLAGRHGPQVVHKVATAIKACWRQALLNGWVTENPWRGQRLPAVPASAGEVLTDAEVAALFEATQREFDETARRRRRRDEVEKLLELTWVDLHLATGARPGEIVGLRWGDVDLDAAIVTFTDDKHGGRPRRVAIDAAMVERLRSWRRAQAERGLGEGARIGKAGHVFSNELDASTPWTTNYAGSFRWPRLRTAAGIRSELRLYDLRHTYNNWLEVAGVDASTRATRIGNSSAVNLRVYGHSTQDVSAASAVADRRAGAR